MNSTLINKPSAFSSTYTFLWRSMLKAKSSPGQMIFDSVVSIISMLLFTFLFGGAIEGSPREYVQFLLPGMLYMTVLPMTVYAGTSLSKDMTSGVYDRFRTLDFWQPAPVVGTLISDIVKYTIAVICVTLTGISVGFRPEGRFAGLLLGMLLAVLYAFSLSWIFAAWGIVARKTESVAQNSMAFLYISIFCSNIFTDAATMPGWIQAVIKFNPTTYIATATRLLMQGSYSSWEVILSLFICLGIIIIIAPITFTLYRRKDR